MNPRNLLLQRMEANPLWPSHARETPNMKPLTYFFIHEFNHWILPISYKIHTLCLGSTHTRGSIVSSFPQEAVKPQSSHVWLKLPLRQKTFFFWKHYNAQINSLQNVRTSSGNRGEVPEGDRATTTKFKTSTKEGRSRLGAVLGVRLCGFQAAPWGSGLCVHNCP